MFATAAAATAAPCPLPHDPCRMSPCKEVRQGSWENWSIVASPLQLDQGWIERAKEMMSTGTYTTSEADTTMHLLR